MQRLIKAFGHSLDGIKAAWHGEAAFRLEMMLASVMIPAAFFLTHRKTMLLMMVGSVLLVLVVELINTAIESAVNHTGTDIHPMAKKAKDAGSGAVLLALVNAGLVWAVALL